MRATRTGAFLLAFGLALPGLASASDGALEINHACATTGCFAGDTPGDPVTINAPGSYRLTSNLTPPATDGAVSVKADAVSIDLGGFDVSGTFTCPALPCASGGVTGIEGGNRGTRVSNGSVRKFSSSGLTLGPGARVENVSVHTLGKRAIELGTGSLAFGNVVELAGQEAFFSAPVRSTATTPCATPARAPSKAAARVARTTAPTAPVAAGGCRCST